MSSAIRCRGRVALVAGQLLAVVQRPVGEVLGVRPAARRRGARDRRRAALPRTRGSSPASTGAGPHAPASAWRTRLLFTNEPSPSSTSIPSSPCTRPATASTASRVRAGEHGEEREQPLLVAGEQLVAPADRVAQCPLAFRRVAAPPLSRLSRSPSRSTSACGENNARRAVASSIASGRPSSRTQSSTTAGAFSAVSSKSAPDRPRALDEQLHRLVLGQLRRPSLAGARRRAARAAGPDRPARP